MMFMLEGKSPCVTSQILICLSCVLLRPKSVSSLSACLDNGHDPYIRVPALLS